MCVECSELYVILACGLAENSVVGHRIEIIAKRLEHRLYQTPSDVEFNLGPTEKPHRELQSIAASRVPIVQMKIRSHIIHCHHDIGQSSSRKIQI